MKTKNRREHWENIYQHKSLDEVSWYQPTPRTSLNFVESLNIPTTAKIIDIGGGDSFLVDHLLDRGFGDLTVLDISEAALKRAQKRLDHRARQVKWIIADAADFQPQEQYDLWHDRAAFHFLTDEKDIASYIRAAKTGITDDGVLVLGTFSTNGPSKCSGIPIQQYSEESMTNRLKPDFQKIGCITTNHTTPFDTEQQFVFCSFKKV